MSLNRLFVCCVLIVDGPCMLTASLNSAIHVLMYTYYFTNAYGFKSDWTMILKKFTTKAQMVILRQFYLLVNECISNHLYYIYLFSRSSL